MTLQVEKKKKKILIHGDAVVKNLLANAEDSGDVGLIPGSEDSLEKEMATPSSILAWKIPWTEVSGGLWSMGSKQLKTQNS